MKNLITTLLLFFAFTVSAQQYEIKDGKFFTTVRNGNGENVAITFTITPEVIEDIQMTDHYNSFLIDETFIKNNMEKRKMKDAMTVYLFSEVNSAIGITTAKLKNKTSFVVQENSIGAIRFENGSTKISFPFTAKNDYGQPMSKTSVVQKGAAIFIN